MARLTELDPDDALPNPRLQRTPSAPLIRKALGRSVVTATLESRSVGSPARAVAIGIVSARLTLDHFIQPRSQATVARHVADPV